MNFLEYYVNNNVINKLKEKYNKKLISSIIYNQDNVISVLEYFKNLGFELDTLLINRLDIFLINIDIIKNNIDNCDSKIIDVLKNDISVFDYLLNSVG